MQEFFSRKSLCFADVIEGLWGVMVGGNTRFRANGQAAEGSTSLGRQEKQPAALLSPAEGRRDVLVPAGWHAGWSHCNWLTGRLPSLSTALWGLLPAGGGSFNCTTGIT